MKNYIRDWLEKRNKENRIKKFHASLKDYPYTADVEGVAARLIKEGKMRLGDFDDNPSMQKAIRNHLELLKANA